MKTVLEMRTETPPVDPPEFSLVLGGALFQLSRRTRLTGEALERLYRQAILLTVVTWLPLLLLSFLQRHAATRRSGRLGASTPGDSRRQVRKCEDGR